MRISDWSSDVCSSDLERALAGTRFDPALIRALGVDAARLSLIRAQGESMLPTIADGDEIMVDTGDRRLTSRRGISVVRGDAALMVKRAAHAGLGLSIRSANPASPGNEDSTTPAPGTKTRLGKWMQIVERTR